MTSRRATLVATVAVETAGPVLDSPADGLADEDPPDDGDAWSWDCDEQPAPTRPRASRPAAAAVRRRGAPP